MPDTITKRIETTWEQQTKRVCEANNLSVSQTDNIFYLVRSVVQTLRIETVDACLAEIEKRINDRCFVGYDGDPEVECAKSKNILLTDLKQSLLKLKE